MNRSACESYEVHLSALMDGEAAPADVMSLLDHLPTCASCSAFLQEMRMLQDAVDAAPVPPGSTQSIERDAVRLGRPFLLQGEMEPSAMGDDDAPDGAGGTVGETRPGRIVAMERTPRWVWALAACLLVALGFGLGDRTAPDALPLEMGADGTLVVELGADAGRMTEERFVSLAVELLRADRRYRDKMSEVLQEVAANDGREGFDSELARWRDESSPLRSEEGASGMEEVLHLSPLKDVY